MRTLMNRTYSLRHDPWNIPDQDDQHELPAEEEPLSPNVDDESDMVLGVQKLFQVSVRCKFDKYGAVANHIRKDCNFTKES